MHGGAGQAGGDGGWPAPSWDGKRWKPPAVGKGGGGPRLTELGGLMGTADCEAVATKKTAGRPPPPVFIHVCVCVYPPPPLSLATSTPRSGPNSLCTPPSVCVLCVSTTLPLPAPPPRCVSAPHQMVRPPGGHGGWRLNRFAARGPRAAVSRYGERGRKSAAPSVGVFQTIANWRPAGLSARARASCQGRCEYGAGAGKPQ